MHVFFVLFFCTGLNKLYHMTCLHIILHTLKTKGYLLVSVVPWRTLTIYGNLPLCSLENPRFLMRFTVCPEQLHYPLQKNPSGSAHSLVFYHFLHIWTLSNSDWHLSFTLRIFEELYYKRWKKMLFLKKENGALELRRLDILNRILIKDNIFSFRTALQEPHTIFRFPRKPNKCNLHCYFNG